MLNYVVFFLLDFNRMHQIGNCYTFYVNPDEINKAKTMWSTEYDTSCLWSNKANASIDFILLMEKCFVCSPIIIYNS